MKPNRKRNSRVPVRRWTGPVIAREVVSGYLNRELDDWRWIKDVKRKDLEKEVNGFHFFTKPYQHQLACFTLGMHLPRFLFFLDMGGGKTKLSYDLYRYHQQQNGVKRMLAVSPSAVNVDTWSDELPIHAPSLFHVKLLGSKKERLELVQDTANVYLINYAGLMVYMTKKVGRKRVVDSAAARKFASMFDMLVLDESHLLGSHTSLVYRLCKILSRHCTVVYAMTGTPIGKDPVKYWSQFNIVDHGETLGTSIGLFRAAFYEAKQNFFGGMDYKFDRRMEKDLLDMIQHRSIRYEDTEFSDLPKKVFRKMMLDWAEEPEAYADRIISEIREARGDLRVVDNVFMRMRQLAAGFLNVRGEDNDTAQIVFDENPKLDALESIIEQLAPGKKITVFHEFVFSGKMICDMLAKHKIKFARLGGSVKDPITEKNRFYTDPNCIALVANSRSGSTGLNPQKVCNTVVFYELPVSPIIRKQAIKRFHRDGQVEDRVFITDLLIRKSIDEQILRMLASGDNLFDVVVNGRLPMHTLEALLRPKHSKIIRKGK